MAEYDNTNTGALFKAKDRRNDKSAEYTGKINVEGTEYWINAWVREAKTTGQKFFSIKIKPVDDERPAPRGNPAARQTAADDDDIPF